MLTDRKKGWILWCTGPSSSQYLDAAIADFKAHFPGEEPRIMTVNAGFKMFEDRFPGRIPKAYMAIEKPVVHEFKQKIKELVKRGSQVWTWPSRAVEIGGSRVNSIPYKSTTAEWKNRRANKFTPEYYGHMHCVGVTALQCLLKEYRAPYVAVVGMDGYEVDKLYDEACDHHPFSPVDEERCTMLNNMTTDYTKQMLPYYREKGVVINFFGPTIHDPDSFVDRRDLEDPLDHGQEDHHEEVHEQEESFLCDEDVPEEDSEGEDEPSGEVL